MYVHYGIFEHLLLLKAFDSLLAMCEYVADSITPLLP